MMDSAEQGPAHAESGSLLVDSKEQGESHASVVCAGKKQMRIGKQHERRSEHEVKGHTFMVDSASEACVALNGLGVHGRRL